MSLSAGEKLGPYEIVEPIGKGGMGEVYRARDARLNRDVAIKISGAQFTERFEREARAIAALNHPNICQIYDVGPNYLVMELIGGSALKGPLPVDHALKYAAQICDALDAAHKKGITHRDLKPANILISKTGIKLLDFGLARVAAADDQTVTMAVMGTPGYMAPEQWEGEPGDARSDVYALGCVLYEMLTGKRPAQDRKPVEPAALESVVATCLAKDPDERWQSAHDVKLAVGQSSSFIPVGQPGGRPYWAGVAVVASVIAIALAVVHFQETPASGELVSFAVFPPEKTVFSAPQDTTVPVPQFALSPDGRTLAFVAGSLLWMRPIAEIGSKSLPGTENAQDPFWSPDGRWLGFYAGGKVKKVPAAGGAVQVIAQASAADLRGGAWGPDDTILFASGAEPIYRVSAAGGGTATPVTILDVSREEGSHRFPRFLPDGRHFIYTVIGGQAGVYAGSLDNKTKKPLVPLIASAVYASPGYLMYVDGDSLLGQPFDAQRLEVSGQPFLVAEHVGRSSAYYSAISTSRTGTLAYSGILSQPGRLTWFDRGGNAVGSAGPEGDYSDFRLSPNERLLAASLVDPKAGTLDIWMTDLERNSTSRFAFGAVLTASPSWSPDSAKLVFRTLRNGNIEFYERSASGGGNAEPVLIAAAERAAQIRSINLIPTDWSPDGHNILFSVPAGDSGGDLWMLPLAGDGKPVKFLASQSDEIHGNFSPDGHLVAYTSNESGKYEVYVQTFPLSDRRLKVSTAGGYEPRWRADGQEMYFLSEDRKLMAVSVGAGPVFGVPKELFQTRVSAGVTANRMHYVPGRDGKRFLVNTQTGDPVPTPITVVLNWTTGLKK